ncbi:site-specific integrase [Frankia sp. Cr1]|uniref:site-specific integrase n=1 Tax=Frankia sp. Cr1 TaxID=3073931 RepID=UPI002AD51821|nr:site-specific integrase [Frankia sp. Cr1]
MSAGLAAPAALARTRPGIAADLLDRFPPRPVADRWEATALGRDELTARLLAPPFTIGAPTMVPQRRRALARFLDWLSQFPGGTWQQRWEASGASQDGQLSWRPGAAQWLVDTGRATASASWLEETITYGFGQMVYADALRPSLSWLLSCSVSFPLTVEISRLRDPAGFAELRARAAASGLALTGQRGVVELVAVLVAAKGGLVADITVGDCLELIETRSGISASQGGRKSGTSFYQVLRGMGLFPAEAPATLRMINPLFQGQLSPGELIDQYALACRPVRDLLVDYLEERRPGVDHTTVRALAYYLGKLFWKDLETHNPGIDSLHLPADVAAAWQQRVMTRTLPLAASVGEPATAARLSATNALLAIRAFYEDIAHWALEDPRWVPWAVPCPVRVDRRAVAKERQHRQSRMDQRTRERLPVLPTLTDTAVRRLADAQALLTGASAAEPGAVFTVGAVTLRRSQQPGTTARVTALDPDTGRLRDLARAEEAAFFSWAAIEVLRATGIRVEELTELSHHSLVQYRVPSTGELVPLLHIAPSKTDIERLLVISPELADVLAALLHRVRDADGAVPLVIAYDRGERTFLPPMPVLFQRCVGADQRPIPAGTIREWVTDALAGTGLTDASGVPLRFTPHDFRRIFATEAIMNGMPPHICQLIIGHKDINTTMGYKAVYPEEAINGHRAFIARRRELRPAAEYRTPTDEEWEEFLGHFERRRLELGDCGRAWGASCRHEHSCIRCPMLRVDPAQRGRLVEIRDNLLARIAEAEQKGWAGEVEGLKVSLAAANNKLAQLELADARRRGAADLGMPTFGDTATRTITVTPAAGGAR